MRCTVHTDSVVYGREERSERRDKSEKGARKDTMGVVNSVKSFLYFWYLQYTLNTSIYMLEPLEQFLFNVFLVGFLSISAYTFYVFVPAHVVQIYELIFGLRQVPAAT